MQRMLDIYVLADTAYMSILLVLAPSGEFRTGELQPWELEKVLRCRNLKQ